ncbi:MAG TPA: DNA polymerase [Jatrophihabitans sp.]|nr:DNA polymerase [Jatrophihabitans sp.]
MSLLDRLRAGGFGRGDFLALCLPEPAGSGAVGCAWDGGEWASATAGLAQLTEVESALRPRWVWWDSGTPHQLAAAGLRVATCWDLTAAHRLLFGGWRAGPATIWAALHDLGAESLPAVGQLDLLGPGGDEGTDPDDPVRPDGHLRPEWAGGGWQRTPERLSRWAGLALAARRLQERRLTELEVPGDPLATVRSESAAELLCAELFVDGLPIDLPRAEQLIGSFVGPRPADAGEATSLRERRDAAVLRLVPGAEDTDLRNPAQVRALLARIGIDVPDTRSTRLEHFRGAHPAVEALLSWRKSERIATTYGYDWLDRNVGPDGRLRGAWSGSDGAAGRMTAQAGLHNLPADLRPAVAAGPGQVFVRADLGQIEPRVLAAVSGDRALAAAAQDEDLYAPVASRLGVERAVAKIAVLAAMYGQTSGTAGAALRGLESAYPVAMRYLRDAHEAGRAGRNVRTYGGRLVRMWPTPAGLSVEAERSVAAARGRYARNAMVQGAAAELFKVWAVTVRARGAELNARVVLCLHDELLVHAPASVAGEAEQLVRGCLAEAARRWAPGSPVRFVADVSVVQRWSEAK